MNLTSKSRYALKIMMDLAYHSDQCVVRRRDIAKRHGIPTEYLDQIMILLRRADLVRSTRGRGGGYSLARPAKQISVWQLFSAVESSMEPVLCLSSGQSCGFDVSCSSQPAWRMIYEAFKKPLEEISLEGLTREELSLHLQCPAAGIRECRPPRHLEETVQ
jgi:Rrf2 family protein